MNIVNHIELGAKLHPQRPAILFEGKTISYEQLNEEIARAATGLCRLGVRQGDRIALFLPNIPAFAVAYFATVKIGAIAVAVNARSTAGELRGLLLDSGAEILVATEALCAESFPAGERLPQVRHVLIAEGDPRDDLSLDALIASSTSTCAAADVPAGTPAAILYTSGTTGQPKGATLSHGNVDFVMRAKVEYLGIGPQDRLLLFLPLSHCFGQNAILNAALAAGASVVLHRRFDAEAVLRSIGQDGATMFFGVPTTFVLMLEKATPEQLKNLRYFFSAAAALPREIEERWLARFGSVIYQGYGLTESSPFATYNHIREHRIGSLGTAIAGVEIAIAKVHDGYTAEAGERGEILIRGANVMLGYWNKPEETAECLREGWLHTGDIGRMDTDGYLTIEDRLKDMVIVGGTNVFPAEVEQVLYQHGSVLEAAVYGRPDAVLGELVCAAVVLRPEAAASEEMLVRFCSERLAEFKVPTAIEFVSELPKGPTGKVLKRLLREHCAVVNAPERMMPCSTEDLKVITNVRELEARIIQWLSETLHVKAGFLKRNTPFGEYGVTSLMAVELAARLCAWLGKAVPPTVAWRFSTVAALARHYFPEPEKPPQAQLPVGDLLPHLSDVEAETLLLRELARLGIDGGRA